MANDGTVKIGVGFETDTQALKKIKSDISSGLSGVATSVSSAVSSTFTALANSAKASLSIATTGLTALTAGIGSVATYAVSVGKSFESSMSQVMATMGITKDTIEDGVNSYELLKQAAENAGAETIYSASEAADALNYLALAGYDAQKAVDALPTVLNLAQAGGMELATATDMITDAMAALGIETNSENLTEFGDKLAKTASSANTSVSQLGEAILTVGGTANSLADGTTELNAALGVLANRGIKGAEGGTALRNLITSLTTPTEKAASALEELGIDVFDDAGEMRNLNTIFSEFNDATSEMSTQEKKTLVRSIFNKYDLAAAEAMISGAGEEFSELAEKIKNSNGAMEQMAETMAENLEGRLKSLKSRAEALGNAFYDNLNEPASAFLGILVDMLTELNNVYRENGLTAMLDTFGDDLAELVTLGTEKMPDFLSIGTQIISSMGDGMIAHSPEIIKAFRQIMTELPRFIKTYLDTVFNVGGVIVDGIVDDIRERPDDIANAILYLMFAIPDFVISRLETLVPIGTEVVTKIINGIAEKSEDIADAVLNALLEIPDFFISNLETLLSIGTMIIDKITMGIDQNKNMLIEKTAELIDVFISSIAENIPKLVDIGKTIIKTLSDSISKAVPILQPFGDAVKFIVDHIESLATFVGSLWVALKGYTILTSVSKAIDSVKDAVVLLSTAMVTNPLAVIATSLGILTGIISALYVEQGKTNKRVTDAVKIEQEYNKQLSDNRDKLKALGDAAEETAKDESTHLDKVESLWKELDNLADASGRVKDADRERADYILGELNDALGTEYTMTDGQIDKYKELKETIQDVIKQKRAETLLNAYSGQYEEAVSQQSETQKLEISSKVKRDELGNAIDEFRKKLEVYEDDLNAFDVSVDDVLQNPTYYLNSAINSLGDKRISDILKKVSDVETSYGTFSLADYQDLETFYIETSNNYAEARSALDNINEIISGYEKASAETLAGNYDNVADYLNFNADDEIDLVELSKKNEEEITKQLKEELSYRQTAVDEANDAYVRSTNSANQQMLEDAKDNLQQFLIDVDNMGLGDFLNEEQKSIVDAYKQEQEQEIKNARLSEWAEAGYTPNSAADVEYYQNTNYSDYANLLDLERYQKEYEKLKEQYQKGINDVTESMVEEAKKTAEEKQPELEEAYNTLAEKGVHGLTVGMTNYENTHRAVVSMVDNVIGATKEEDVISVLETAGSDLADVLLNAFKENLSDGMNIADLVTMYYTADDNVKSGIRNSVTYNNSNTSNESNSSTVVNNNLTFTVRDNSDVDSIAELLQAKKTTYTKGKGG